AGEQSIGLCDDGARAVAILRRQLDLRLRQQRIEQVVLLVQFTKSIHGDVDPRPGELQFAALLRDPREAVERAESLEQQPPVRRAREGRLEILLGEVALALQTTNPSAIDQRRRPVQVDVRPDAELRERPVEALFRAGPVLSLLADQLVDDEDAAE